MDGKFRTGNNVGTFPIICPRCKTVTRILSETKYPYCQGCNWDSLTDVITERKTNFKKENIDQKNETTNSLFFTE